MSEIKFIENELAKNNLPLKKNEPLAPYTTIKVGGKAKYLVISDGSDSLSKLLVIAKRNKIPFIILGKGSNVIISDKGFDGMVIINTSLHWQLLGDTGTASPGVRTKPRFESDFSGFEKKTRENNSDSNKGVIIRVDSGVPINFLIHALHKDGITGLEWFTGIPATVGGAIYMNMHGGEYFFGELVENATVSDGYSIKSVSNEYFQFEYDRSILHRTGEVVISADLRLVKGNLDSARKLTREWAAHKALQPRKSAGCIFKNLSDQEQQKLGLPTSSTGYLIDKVLGLKGKRIGDAIISNKHAAFIENLGEASAEDIYKLIKLIKQRAASELGIDLHEEIQLIGEF